MAKMKVRIGKDFIDSSVEVDGQEIRAHKATITVEAGEMAAVEVERRVHASDGHYLEVIRKRLDKPVEVEVEVPDSVKNRR